MVRWLAPMLAAVVAGSTACGGDDGARMRLSTPPEREGAEPLPHIRAEREQAERDARVRPTQVDAERSAAVLRGWANALRRNREDRAADFFTIPAIVAQGVVLRLTTEAQVRRFNLELPCGARLIGVGHEGRYVIGTFRLTPRPEHLCTTPGERVRVAFVMRGKKIAEWRQVPDTPGAPPGPEAPENAPPPPPDRIS